MIAIYMVILRSKKKTMPRVWVDRQSTNRHLFFGIFRCIAQNHRRFKACLRNGGIISDNRPGKQNIEDVVASAPPVCYIWTVLTMLDT